MNSLTTHYRRSQLIALPVPFSECSGGASSRTGEKRRHHDKAWRGPGHHASYRGEGRRQRGGRDYPLTACR